MRRLLLLCLFCGIVFVLGQPLAVQADTFGRVAGQIKTADEDECRGRVSLWPVTGQETDDESQFYGVPPWSTKLKSDCSFLITAKSGSYYLRAVLRKTPGPVRGPARAGDHIFISPDANGNLFQVEVARDSVTDNYVGIHSFYTVFSGYPDEFETGVTGRLVDPEGRPVANFLVIAFSDEKMLQRPVAISLPSDEQGRFQLPLPGKRNIYLQASEKINLGQTPTGHLGGIYGGKKTKVVKIKKGKRNDNIEIVVQRRTAAESEETAQ